jgi:3-oxoacyl-(acyl-carrier-protein) synthase
MNASRGLGEYRAATTEAGIDAQERRPFVLVDQVVRSLGLSPSELEESAIFAGTTTGISASEEITYLKDRQVGLPWEAAFHCGGPGRLAAFCTHQFGIKGPAFTYTTACTSTGVGIVMAARMLRQGRIRRAIVLGLDLMMKMSLTGFRSLQLYSQSECRPFDARRDGLCLGEACAALVLEPGEAPWQLLDGAICHDPGHIAAGSADGLTASTVMTQALLRSGIKPSEVSAIKAHGTGTPTNDLTELNALKHAFEKVPPFTSLKSTFGHTLAASSALECVTWTWCVDDGFIPGTIGFSQAATESSLRPQLEPMAMARPSLHLFNAFGFGGTSVSFVAEVRR